MFKYNTLLKTVSVIFLSSLLFSTIACETDRQSRIRQLPPTLSGKETILVLPFRDFTKAYGESTNVSSPYSGKLFMTGPVEEDAEEYLTEGVMILLGTRTEFHIIPPGNAEGVLSDYISQENFSQSELTMVLNAGRELGAEMVMVGNLYRYRERVGNKYSVNSPASVAFELNLFRVDDGRLLWSGFFDETQHSLSENLLHIDKFIKSKGKWITAGQMADRALEELLEPFCSL